MLNLLPSLVNHDIESEFFCCNGEVLRYDCCKAMNVVNEQHVAFIELGQQASKIRSLSNLCGTGDDYC